MMKVSVGILAFNESASIGTTIASIAAQELVRTGREDLEWIEVVCVPNGCTDDTAERARAAFARAAAGLPPAMAGKFRWRVEELERGGKTNAWNEFVHRISSQDSDYLVLCDGDIRVDHPETLGNLVGTLERTPAASVCVPRPIKHIALKKRRSVMEWVSLQLSAVNRGRTSGIAGCLYCGRGSVLRRIWFPEGLIGEDAFLNGLVLTDLCRSEERYERVVGTENATVVFEAYTTIPAAYKCLRRQAVTRGVNGILWDYLWKNVGELDAGELIKKRSDEDPEWFKKLLSEQVRQRGWWVMPKGVLLRRARFLRNLPVLSAVRLLPAAAVAMLVDVVVHVDANSRLKSGRVKGLWQTTRTTEI